MGTQKKFKGSLEGFQSIPDFPGYFYKDGEVIQINVMSYTITPNGYTQYKFKQKDGHRRSLGQHQVEAIMHLGLTLEDIDNGMQVNHKDYDKLNNDINNLEVVTPKENCRHRDAKDELNYLADKSNWANKTAVQKSQQTSTLYPGDIEVTYTQVDGK